MAKLRDATLRDTDADIEPPRRSLVSTLVTVAALTLSIAATGVAFFGLTLGSLHHAHVDQGLADMDAILTFTKNKLPAVSTELPIRVLTDPTRALRPPDVTLQGQLGDLIDPTTGAALETADPWGHSFLVVAERTGTCVRLSCLSPGPNGIFESDPVAGSGVNDDVCRAIDVVVPQN